MELSDLGFDEWFREQRTRLGNPDMLVARITAVDRDRYLVRNEQDEIQGEATGKLLFSAESAQSLPCVGDWVLVQYYNDRTLAIIHDLLPRKSFLRRKAPGKKIEYQMIAANVDVAFIMQSCDRDFNLRRMERYLVMTADGGIEPVVVLSKSDCVTPGALEEIRSSVTQSGIEAPVLACSTLTGYGLDSLHQRLRKGGTYCLLGSSGVGKTTLLNHLLGREEFSTAPVREKDGRGKHTTARRQLIVLDTGALLIDTPGLRELGMAADETALDQSFSDIERLSEACKFADCTHTVEAGCAVRAALASGELDEDRYQNYLKLQKEANFYQLSYVERRKKDKKFGKMVKTALKHVKKRKS